MRFNANSKTMYNSAALFSASSLVESRGCCGNFGSAGDSAGGAGDASGRRCVLNRHDAVNI